MNLATAPVRGRPGRPTREEAELRHRALLECALDHFIERGFEQATIRDIATANRMTRRTVYSRYADKQELFRATLEHAVSRLIVPQQSLDSLDRTDLRGALLAVIRLRVANTLTPAGLQLQRFLHTESYRFPELVTSVYGGITRPVIAFVVDLLQLHNSLGTTDVANPERAAEALMNLAVGVPVRLTLLGKEQSPEEIEERIEFSVDLFMNGICRRVPEGAKR